MHEHSGCVVWSAPLLVANPEDRFSRVEAHLLVDRKGPTKPAQLHTPARSLKLNTLQVKIQWGCTLMFPCIRRLGSFLWEFKIMNFNIFGGMNILWIFFFFFFFFFFFGGGGRVLTKLDYI